MEHGRPFLRYGHLAKSSSDSNPLQAGNSSTNSGAVSNPNNDGARIEERPSAPPNLVVQEEEQCVPIANVTRIMRRVLPSQAKVSDDAKEAIQECVSEFISFITSEANERCQHEHRKIVTAEDVLWAMDRLGFDDYLGPLTIFLQRYRQNEVDCLTHHGGHVLMRRSIANYGMPPPSTPPPPASYGSNFPTSPSLYQGMFDSTGIGGLYTDGSSASGSRSGSAMNNFDPFAYLRRDRLR